MSRSGIFQVNQILSPPTPPNVPSFPASSSSNSFFHVRKKRWRKEAPTALWDKISNP